MRLLGLEWPGVANPEHRDPICCGGLRLSPNQVWCRLHPVTIMDCRWRGGCPHMDTSSAWRPGGGVESYGAGDATPIRAASSPVRVHWIAGDRGLRCSMDGRGRCMDNVFIERLWRSLKYEAVYLPSGGPQRVIAQWIGFYNEQRPRSPVARLRKPTVTGWRNVRRRWRSEQERQATGMGYEGIRGRTSASVGSYPHIHSRSPPPRTLPPFTAACG